MNILKQIVRKFSFHARPFPTFTSNAEKQRKKLEKSKGIKGLTNKQRRKRDRARLKAGKNPDSADDTDTDYARESEEEWEAKRDAVREAARRKHAENDE